MKSILKPLLLSATLSAIGLSNTICHASASLSSDGIERSIPISVESAITSNNSAGGMTPRQFNSFEYLMTKPLLRLSINEVHAISSQPAFNSAKKNEVFEVAAIFNDKLQQFLAYIDDDIAFELSEEEIKSATLSDKKCRAGSI